MEEKIETKNTPVEVNEEVKPEVEIHYKELSPIRMVVRRFFRSKLSLVGVIMLAVLFTFAFAGPPLLYAFGYEWRSLEVHIGHPKGDEIFRSIYVLKCVGLDRTASPAVDHLVEVIYFHLWHILYPPQI